MNAGAKKTDLGCAVLIVHRKASSAGNPVIANRIFCPQVNYYTDWRLMDSIHAFQNRYTTDSTYVELQDSIYKHFDPVRVKRDLKKFEDSGYSCACSV